ncbi:stage V sporulation protein B [Haloplasma contractile]|uniref:Stage V sporulation protein B n=1 Tax=Haloplasma contractile SSD-17B TaxID=1033810 RepID=F7PVT1_9MOLU|nr:stage V sporulation protein B [Haloplasma contractile]ERJ12747.1 Stage V sporulation protein B [Haloplasma contractile SSD-17B]
MRKQNFIQGTVILVVVGFIVKVLGLVNRVVIARYLTTEGVGIYMMTIPTLILFISLAQLGFPIAISKLVSENNVKKTTSNKRIVFSALKISLVISILLVALLLIGAKFLATELLNEPRTYYPLLSLLLFIPLVSFSSILKGYLTGHKIISVSAYAQLFEQIVRIITSVTLVLVLLPYGLIYAVCGAIISISLGEIASIIYMIYRIKNKRSWQMLLTVNDDMKDYDKDLYRDILTISLPATGSRLIGSMSHFLEPIIFSTAMLAIGLSSQFTTEVYGAFSGYAIPLLLIPSFISVAISTPLIPTISEAYATNNLKTITHHFNQAIFLSFVSGALATIVLSIYPNELMKLLFNTEEGTKFLSYMAPLFLMYYFQLPITSTLHAIDKAKHAMVNTLIGSLLKVFLIYVLVTNPAISYHGLAIAVIVNIVYVTIANYLVLRKSIEMKFKLETPITSILLMFATLLFGLYLRNTLTSEYAFILNIFIITLFYIGFLFIFDIGEINRVIKQMFKSNAEKRKAKRMQRK